jgi:hypothetical protein
MIVNVYNRCVGGTSKTSEKSQWIITKLQNNTSFRRRLLCSAPAAASAAAASSPPASKQSSSRSAAALWQRLRLSFRLVALRMRRADIIALQQRLAEEKLRLAQATRAAEPEPCVICLDAAIDTVLLDCGHLCVCRGCVQVVKSCPVCQTALVDFVLIKPIAPALLLHQGSGATTTTTTTTTATATIV